MNFGEKIRRIMFEYKLTQKQFADKINTKDSSVNRWINGTSKNPTLETITKISKAFNVPVSYLTDDSQEDFKGGEKLKIDKNDNIVSLVMELIEKNNNVMEEKMKRFEVELQLIKNEINHLQKK